MNRARIDDSHTPRSFAFMRRVRQFVRRVAIVVVVLFPHPADAITINMTYTDEGDPVPHDENPSWDPAGLILKAHFQRAN